MCCLTFVMRAAGHRRPARHIGAIPPSPPACLLGSPSDFFLESISLLRWHRLQLNPERVVALHLALSHVHPVTNFAAREAELLTKLHLLYDPWLVGNLARVRLGIQLQVADPEMLDAVLIFNPHFDMEVLVPGLGISEAGQELVKSGTGICDGLLHFLFIKLAGDSL